MALGFCPALLQHIDAVAEQNAPGKKMHVAGFLAMLFCCQNSSVSPINDNFEQGHTRPMSIWYRRRPTQSDVQDEETCDINYFPGRLEWIVPGLIHRQTSFHIPDSLIGQYCTDASALVSAGAPSTQVMAEVWDIIVDAANNLLRAVNIALVTAQATEFGVNTTTHSDTGKVINISKNGNDFVLDNGVIAMMQDIKENEICGTPCLVGGGIYSAYDQARAIACCNAGGIDLSRTGVPNFYFDKETQSIWGNNTVGLFAPGSVKFITRNQFVGSFAGQKGTSFFTTLPLPVEEFGCADPCLSDLMFDLQLKYYDCPTEVSPGVVVQRGWQGTLSKQFNLWTQPTNGFAAGDPLFNTNGTLKYFVTNNSSQAAAYAYPA